MSGMHLLPAYWTTNNTKKRKKRKKTKAFLAAEREHEKYLKKMGYTRSRSSVGSEQRPSKPWVASSSLAESTNNAGIAQMVEQITCNDKVVGSTPTSSTILYDPSMTRKKPMNYTGDQIIGIAQMHKSNAVPIRGKKAAEEVTRMRR